MKLINIETWERKDHFYFFKKMKIPYFNVTGDIDVTSLVHFCKKEKISFYACCVYFISRTCNEIESFKLRIREDKVILHDSVNPAPTYMKENLFHFYKTHYQENLKHFLEEHQASLMNIKKDLSEDKNLDSLIFMTYIPWISFTGISHPMNHDESDSIPRIAWGKYKTQENSFLMPLSIQGHHSLMDGYHVGLYFEHIQKLISNIEKIYNNT